MKKIIHSILFGGYLIFLCNNLMAQAETTPTKPAHKLPTLQEKVAKSDAIIEGCVVETNCFEDSNGRIYTAATIRISKIFDGEISDTVIDLLYIGGSIGDRTYSASHAFSIEKGQDGIFFLKTNRTRLRFSNQRNSYVPLNGPYCYIEYHHNSFNHKGTCYGVFYDDIERDVFQPIEAATKTHRRIISPSIFDLKTTEDSKTR